jgi:hypothetical protein
MIEQDIPGQCPECRTELTIDNIIEVGEYPIGGYRNSMKPNQTKAFIFECPKCFEKSCHHINDDMSETFYRYQSTKEAK